MKLLKLRVKLFKLFYKLFKIESINECLFDVGYCDIEENGKYDNYPGNIIYEFDMTDDKKRHYLIYLIK